MYEEKKVKVPEIIYLSKPLVKKKEVSEFRKFIWSEEPEGRLVELWEK